MITDNTDQIRDRPLPRGQRPIVQDDSNYQIEPKALNPRFRENPFQRKTGVGKPKTPEELENLFPEGK